MKPFTVILLLFGSIALAAGSVAAGGRPKLNPGNRVEARTMIAAHNRWRSQAGVAGLTWSPRLEKKAIAWANELKQHNGCRMRHSGPGENLYWASPLEIRTSTDGRNWQVSRQAQEVDADHVVNSWGSEKQWYSYAGNSCRAPAGKSCGHYTQLVWRGTSEVGCGKAVCPGYSQVWVCEYSPPGNIIGDRPY